MKVLILGGGVIGVTSAYLLGARGYEVEVVERAGEVAADTSFANGGQLSFSHAEPWANKAVLPKILQWMFKDDAPLVFRFRPDPHMIRWGMSFLRNCTTERARANSVNILRLGLYSKKKMEQLRVMTGVPFDNIREGILHIFTQQAAFDHAVEQAHYQEKFGCKEDVLSLEACITKEPALAHAGKKIVGGIFAGLDESGDAYQFTKGLAALCEKEFNTQFRYHTNVEKITTDKGRITGVVTDQGTLTADAYVMSLGSYSPVHLRRIGIRVPIYPMKGYSITLPANQYTPTVSITDNELKLVFSRLGNRLRVAGTAEFAGYNHDIMEHRISPMVRATKELFPSVDVSNVGKWACLRPSTPDGPPIVGKTKYENLYMNTGHGTLGWTQAAGSAFLLADIMEGRPTEISLAGLDMERYQ